MKAEDSVDKPRIKIQMDLGEMLEKHGAFILYFLDQQERSSEKTIIFPSKDFIDFIINSDRGRWCTDFLSRKK